MSSSQSPTPFGGTHTSEATSERAAPRRLEAPDRPRHICLVYERSAEAHAAVVAFFGAGLALGERCLYQGDAASWRRIERALAEVHPPVRGARGRALGVLAAAPGDDPRAWPETIRAAAEEALAGGFPGLRISWEASALAPGQGEPGDRPPGMGGLVELEEQLDRALAGTSASLLCRYSRQRSPAALLLRAMQAHPAAMLGGEMGPNVFYEPERGAPEAARAEGQVQRMLALLRRELRREHRVRDLERRLGERAVALDRAEEDRQQLVAMLGHELRNPLSTVSLALSVLRLRGGAADADEKWRRALEAAERQVFHQAALVDDLLEAARASRGELDLHFERLDLARLVPDVVEACREELRQAGVVLDVELTGETLPVSGDRLRLWQAVTHLLQNAMKFSPAGGRVTVRLRRSEGGRAEISVRDCGTGIAPELLPHVFEIFTQAEQSLDRARGGLGVGLAVVKGVIERHGGEVRATSAGLPGQGSEFSLLLPLMEAPRDAGKPSGRAASARGPRKPPRPRSGRGAGTTRPGARAATAASRAAVREGAAAREGTAAREDAAAREGAAAPRPAAGARSATVPAGHRILIVEDNLDTAETLRDLLELSGFEVEVAGSGPEGVAAAHRFHPETVLCDLGLPVMDGYEVAVALRHDPETAATRLIALTGYGGDEDRRRSREAGFDLHLTKPVDLGLLRRLLANGGALRR